MTTLKLGTEMKTIDIDRRRYDDPERFVDYVCDYYEDREDAIFPIFGMVRENISNYCMYYISIKKDFIGDTVDRENVRKLIEHDNNALRSLLGVKN